jgi:CO dehydrogenase maturation factor
MEHLSRRTTRDVQHLLVISDPSLRGIVAAERIAGFRKELDIHIDNTYLIVNRLSGDLPPVLQTHVDKLDIHLLGVIPADEGLAELEYSGQALVDLDDNSPVYQSVASMLQKIL